jgi:hypothetical protein
MKDTALLADWVRDLARATRREITDLTPEALAWQPDPLANDIGVTVWHMARWLDMLTVQVLQGRPAEEEQWHTRHWAEQTGYDPRGIGYRGLGVITGYTPAEVAAVPRLSAETLLIYLDDTAKALADYLLALPPDALEGQAPGLGGDHTVYDWIKGVLMGAFGHIGEIQAFKALRSRTPPPYSPFGSE